VGKIDHVPNLTYFTLSRDGQQATIRVFRQVRDFIDIGEHPNCDSVSEDFPSSNHPPKPDHKVDLVVAKYGSMPEDVIDQFDLEICKICFDCDAAALGPGLGPGLGSLERINSEVFSVSVLWHCSGERSMQRGL